MDAVELDGVDGGCAALDGAGCEELAHLELGPEELGVGDFGVVFGEALGDFGVEGGFGFGGELGEFFEVGFAFVLEGEELEGFTDAGAGDGIGFDTGAGGEVDFLDEAILVLGFVEFGLCVVELEVEVSGGGGVDGGEFGLGLLEWGDEVIDAGGEWAIDGEVVGCEAER